MLSLIGSSWRASYARLSYLASTAPLLCRLGQGDESRRVTVKGRVRGVLAHVVTCGYTDIMIASVRTTKARLSELLEGAAAGEEVVITSDGRPKAKLVGIPPVRVRYRVNRRLLAVATRKAGTPAEKLVRQDRDGRD